MEIHSRVRGTLRRSLRGRLFSLVALALLATAPIGCTGSDSPTAPMAPGGGSPAPGPSAPEAQAFVTLMNQHRVSLGLSPLAWDGAVAAVATAHSQDMLDRGFFSHTNPDGETPWDRLAAAGITYTAAGENIAWGYPTGSAVLAAWLSSTGHKANIENPNFTHHGVGLVGTHWTHMFLRR